MSQVTFGDIIQVAERHLDAAEESLGEVTHAAAPVRALYRLVTVIARSLNGRGPLAIEAATGTGFGSWQLAAAHLQEALRQAAQAIGTASEHAGEPGQGNPVRCARQLARTAAALTAGHDLLSGHVALNPAGAPVDRSEWALAAFSPPVTGALVREAARWASRAGGIARRLAAVSGPARPALAQAAELLCSAHEIIQPALAAEPGLAADRDLLMGIPTAAPPERRPPGEPETTAELCSGITTSATRLRSVGFALRATAGTSLDVSASTLRRTAFAGAIVADIASLTLHGLAMRASRLPGCPVDPGRLAVAAVTQAEARNAWEQAAGLWRIMQTDTQSPASTATLDAGDLVVRLGRLAFGNPRWTPAAQHRTPPPTPEALAPDTTELVAVLGAVHQATDATARMAAADLLAIGTLRDAGRLYMPQVIVWATQRAARDYAAAPAGRIQLMQDIYRVITSSARTAAQALGGLVADAGAPGRPLALARTTALAHGDPLHPPIDPQLTLDKLRPRLRTFSKRLDIQVTRKDELDTDDVIRAYQDDQLSISDCALRFCTTPALISTILDDNHIPVRDDRPASPDQPTPPARPDTSQLRWWGPVERRLLALKVTDPGLLLRASALDRASRELITQAEASVDKPARVTTAPDAMTAPRIAAQDAPHTAGVARVQPTGQPGESMPEASSRRAQKHGHAPSRQARDAC
jgi:hypothetical protein